MATTRRRSARKPSTRKKATPNAAEPMFDAVPEVTTEPETEVVVDNATPEPQPMAEPQPQAEPKQAAKPPRDRETRETRRRPVRSGDRLVAPIWAIKWAKENDCVLRYINDPAGDGQRVLDMKEMGWEPVIAPKGKQRNPGVITAGEAGPDSSLVSRTVNKSDGTKAYLVYMPRADYEFYQKEKQDVIDGAEMAMTQGSGIGGDVYGEMKLGKK